MTRYLCLLAGLLLFQDVFAAAPVVRVGSSPALSSAGIYIAKEKGYFKEQGIEADITVFQSSGAPMTALLAKGELDVGGGNLTSGLWNASEQGVGIKIVADKGHIEKGFGYISLLVRSDLKKSGRYKTFQDLKGFKMAFTSLGGTSQEIAADRFLRAGGLTPKDVKYVKMSYAEMNAAFAVGELDATIQLEPYATQAELGGFATKVASVYEIYPDQQSAAIFYSPGFMKKQPKLAVGFMAAYLKGVRDYRNAFLHGKDRAGITDILKKYTFVTDDKVWEKMVPVGLNPDGFVNKKAFAADLRWYKEMGYIQQVPDVDAIVDHTFVEKALKIIDKK